MSAPGTDGVFSRPARLDDALAQLAEHAAAGSRPVLLAGGTDWLVEQHARTPSEHAPSVIDLSALGEIARIERDAPAGRAARYRIGAGVSYLAMRRHPDLSREVPLVAAMAREVGAVQIQARGTLGGNLATGSPAADGVCALAALEATIELASRAGGRRAVPIAEFYTGYRATVMRADELITAVSFEAPGAHWYWRKVGTRLAQAISKVALAATARLDAHGAIAHAAFGMASVGPTTATLPHVRAALIGQQPARLDGAQLRAALARDIRPIDDVRSTGEYRMHVAEGLLAQFLAKISPSS